MSSVPFLVDSREFLCECTIRRLVTTTDKNDSHGGHHFDSTTIMDPTGTVSSDIFSTPTDTTITVTEDSSTAAASAVNGVVTDAANSDSSSDHEGTIIGAVVGSVLGVATVVLVSDVSLSIVETG